MFGSKNFLQTFFRNNKEELATLFRDNIQLNVRMFSCKNGDGTTSVGTTVTLSLKDNSTNKRIILGECTDHIQF
jgi:hypothetical protein